MRACKLLVLLLAASLLWGCGAPAAPSTQPATQQPPTQATVQPQPSYEPDSFTLMIYLCGSDLETRAGVASRNIAEMLEADIPENATVVLQTGGARQWRDHGISEAYSSRYVIRDGQLELVGKRPAVNMGLSSSLLDFLLWADATYPAQNRGVILWDHGGGSMKGACIDEQFHNDILTLPELNEAFARAWEACGRKYAFVGFDACLMATYDMMKLLEPYADYMIASQELIPTSGWDYRAVLSALGSDSFYTEVLASYGQKQAQKASHTLSVVRLDQMFLVDQVVDAIVGRVEQNPGKVKTLLQQGMEFGSEGASGSGLFDLGLIAQSLAIDHSFEAFVTTQNGWLHEKATGISLYFPATQLELLQEYEAICQNDGYLTFLNKYAQYQPEETIVFVNPGDIQNGQLTFEITPESEPYAMGMGYMLQCLEGDDRERKVYSIGTDNDVSFDEGVYTVNFDGNWAYLDGHLLHTGSLGSDDEYGVFYTPVKIGEDICLLLFHYHRDTRSFGIEGYVVVGDVTSRIYDLEEGQQITVLYEDYVSEYESFFYEEGTVTWTQDTRMTVEPLTPGEYLCVPYVVDIYGNVHTCCVGRLSFDGQECIFSEVITE